MGTSLQIGRWSFFETIGAAGPWAVGRAEGWRPTTPGISGFIGSSPTLNGYFREPEIPHLGSDSAVDS